MSGKIAKSQIPLISRSRISPEAASALALARQRLASGNLPPRFQNRPDRQSRTGAPLPRLNPGYGYFEIQVGAAHPGDDQPRGSQRIVLEINEKSRQIAEIYYTDEHYARLSFRRVVS